MEQLLQGLRAAAEGTRLRILGLCAHGDLTVTELVEILGQSQPRVSRHLKLLMEAGLLERNQEGNWAYYRLAQSAPNSAPAGELARLIVDLVPAEDPAHALDLERLQAVKQTYAVQAAAYFRRNAAIWSQIRALHVDEAEVDAALSEAFAGEAIGDLLDIGTGTGHVLRLLSERLKSGVGVDRSPDMLKVARANLFRDGLRHCQVRQADMKQLPFRAEGFDAVTLHMALHYAERPEDALAEAARVLRPGGKLVVIDFAPHEHLQLREEHAHRWLGFSEETIQDHFARLGLVAETTQRLEGGAITVVLWAARRPANDAAGQGPARAAG